MFTNGKVVVSIFHSDQILKVASTAFTVVGDISPNLPSPHLVDLPPRLSMEDINLLSKLSLDGLKSLVASLGESKSKWI